MAVPTNKKELQEAINTHYEKLKKEITTIPEALTTIQEQEGHSKGTFMSIHNLAAYLIGWGELVLKWYKKKELNEPVDFPETGYKWNELGSLAQKCYEDYKDNDFSTITKKLDNTVAQILSLIDTV